MSETLEQTIEETTQTQDVAAVSAEQAAEAVPRDEPQAAAPID